MKIMFVVTLLFGLLFITALSAAEKTLSPHQQRMSLCNQQATAQSLAGEGRKHYIDDCLKHTPIEHGHKSLTPHQQRLRECGDQATQQSLKGEDRSKFMGACLKKQG